MTLTSTRIGRTLGLRSLAFPNTWTLNAPILSLSSVAADSGKDSELSTAAQKNNRRIPFMISSALSNRYDTCLFARGAFIRWNGTVEWNSGIVEYWNGAVE